VRCLPTAISVVTSAAREDPASANVGCDRPLSVDLATAIGKASGPLGGHTGPTRQRRQTVIVLWEPVLSGGTPLRATTSETSDNAKKPTEELPAIGQVKMRHQAPS
jgi:hypothetical protein